MKRIILLLATTVTVVSTTAGVAVAASPAVATERAIGLADTSAVLRGAVNPNGNQTSYSFQYGPTTSFGSITEARSAGHGKKVIVVAQRITGLLPGTKYYYRIGALSTSGSVSGATRFFTTTGRPPASVVTGPAINVGQTTATPTGSINPEGVTTTWAVQYGLTTSYGVQTTGQTPLTAVIAPLPVQVTLGPLAPGTLYHYRLVAVHPHAVTYGLDQTFFTFPRFRRTPRMSTRTSPAHDTGKPYGFTTAGTLHGANFVPASLRCTGRVGIRYYHGSHQVTFVLATVGPDCKFSTPVPFRRLIAGGSSALTVKIVYRGNGYLKSVSRTDHVTLG